MTVDVSIVTPLSEQQTGENESPSVLGSATNGAPPASEEKPKQSYNIDFSVEESKQPEPIGAQATVHIHFNSSHLIK